MTELHGILIIDKPAGMTSADVVSRVKRALQVKRIGHTGTLDPMATGVLPLCLGEATKVAGYLLAEDKGYEGELELGVETDTLDAEGAVTARQPEAAAAVTEAALRQAMAGFLGPGEQIPPMYSALKRNGRRLHELARAGETVVRAPRPIIIHHLEMLRFSPPRARFSVLCSKGTYVRSLVHDIGRILGCGAHLTALRRTSSGAFALDRAIALDQVEQAAGDAVAHALISPGAALGHLPAATVPPARVRAVRDGQPLTWNDVAPVPAPAPGTTVRLLLPGGELLALATIEPGAPGEGPRAAGRLRYCRVFTYGLTNRPVSSNLSASRRPVACRE